MCVIGGILLFASGAVIGGGALMYNQRSVRKATERLQRENDHLRNSAWRDRLDYETARAYRQGYYEGTRNPMSDVERLADTIERKNIDFRTPRQKGGTRREQTPK